MQLHKAIGQRQPQAGALVLVGVVPADLALTRRFVHLHGGTLSLQSVLGQGSTFSFTLPLNPPPGAPPEDTA